MGRAAIKKRVTIFRCARWLFADTELRRAVSLLLVELFLCVHQPDKALSVISYLENLSESDATSLKPNSELESTANEQQVREKRPIFFSRLRTPF